MLVTPMVKEILRTASNYYGNPASLAKMIGVAHSTVFFWLNGKTESISGSVWNKKVCPVLIPFMTPEQRRQLGVQCHPTTNEIQSPQLLRETPPVPEVQYIAQDGRKKPQNPRPAPVFTKPYALLPFNALARLDISLLPLSTFICRERIGETYFSLERRRGFFGVRIDNNDSCGFEPRTELLLASCDRPRTGDLVVARFRDDGAVMVGTYRQENEWISVTSLLNPADVRKWDWEKNLGYMLWCYPVFEAKRSFRSFTEELYEDAFDSEGY